MSSTKEKLVINKDFKQYKHFLAKLPNIFEKEGTTIFKQRNVLKTFDVDDNTRLNVKSFKIPHLFNQIAYATFRESKAKRSYHYAKELVSREINTPTPIAYIELKKLFMLKQSFYISKHIDFDGEMRVLQTGTIDEHKQLILEFARFTAHLHRSRVLHLDFSSGNILFKQQDNKSFEFYLVDLNRMKFDEDITPEIAAYSFRRLWGSDEMITLFVKEYAKNRQFDEKQCLEYTFRYRKKFWTKFKKKYPSATPYSGVK